MSSSPYARREHRWLTVGLVLTAIDILVTVADLVSRFV